MSEPLSILTHYLRLACQEAGVTWNWENDSELHSIEEEIRHIVRAEMADEIRELHEKVAALEKTAAT